MRTTRSSRNCARVRMGTVMVRPGPTLSTRSADELQQGFAHRRDAGVEALGHVAEGQPCARGQVAQHDGGTDFTQHLGG